MATRERPSWKQRAMKRVRDILSSLPADATYREKKMALRPHAPGQYAPATERQAWRAAVRLVLSPPAQAIATMKLLDTGDRILNALLAEYRACAADASLRLVIADRLEELGQDGRARLVRAVRPKVADVARRLWPGDHVGDAS